MKRSPSRSTTTPKRDQISPKNRSKSLLVHIAELSTPVVEVAIKDINASLTRNQCFLGLERYQERHPISNIQ